MEEVRSERFCEDIGCHTFAVNMDQGDVLEFLNLLPEEGNTRGDVFERFRGGIISESCSAARLSQTNTGVGSFNGAPWIKAMVSRIAMVEITARIAAIYDIFTKA